MNNVLIMVLLCLPLLNGCGKTEEKNPPAEPKQAKKIEVAQSPNFYGLIEEYRTILAEDPNNLAAIIGLGNAYYDSGQWKKAIMMYEHALLIDPRNADVHTDMGTSYRNLGMPERALAEYRTALRLEPGHLNARYHMGSIYAHEKKDYRAAIRAWEELLKLAPNYPQADDIRSGIAAFTQVLKKESK